MLKEEADLGLSMHSYRGTVDSQSLANFENGVCPGKCRDDEKATGNLN